MKVLKNFHDFSSKMRWALLFDSILCIMRSDGKRKLNGTKDQQIRKKYDKEKTKKQQQQQERLNYMFLGLIFILFGVFGLFRLGF